MKAQPGVISSVLISSGVSPLLGWPCLDMPRRKEAPGWGVGVGIYGLKTRRVTRAKSMCHTLTLGHRGSGIQFSRIFRMRLFSVLHKNAVSA